MNRCLVTLGALITTRDQLADATLGVLYGRLIQNITLLDDDDREESKDPLRTTLDPVVDHPSPTLPLDELRKLG